MAKKRSPKSIPIVFALFRLFSLVLDHFCTFFALFGLSISDRLWPSVFALFRTIRLLPLSGCHLDSPDQVPDIPRTVRSPIVGSEKALPPSSVTATMQGAFRTFSLKET